jgi:hypothetical protein
MKTLFLQAPSFEGCDGGAGSRYQAQEVAAGVELKEIKGLSYRDGEA